MGNCMSKAYKVVAKTIPTGDRKGETVYTVSPVSYGLLTTDEVAKQISTECTATPADVKAVLDALQYEVIDALQNGNSVRLGDLGSFRLSIKANGSDTSAEAKKTGANAIKAVNVQFTKSTAMKEALSPSNAEFALQADIAND